MFSFRLSSSSCRYVDSALSALQYGKRFLAIRFNSSCHGRSSSCPINYREQQSSAYSCSSRTQLCSIRWCPLVSTSALKYVIIITFLGVVLCNWRDIIVLIMCQHYFLLYLSSAPGDSVRTIVSNQLGRGDVSQDDKDLRQGAHNDAQRGTGSDSVHLFRQDGNTHSEYYDVQQVQHRWKVVR